MVAQNHFCLNVIGEGNSNPNREPKLSAALQTFSAPNLVPMVNSIYQLRLMRLSFSRQQWRFEPHSHRFLSNDVVCRLLITWLLRHPT